MLGLRSRRTGPSVIEASRTPVRKCSATTCATAGRDGEVRSWRSAPETSISRWRGVPTDSLGEGSPEDIAQMRYSPET